MKSNNKPQTKTGAKTKSAARIAVDELKKKFGSELKQEGVDWATLMQQGVIVRLHIRRWRAQTQVTLQDLGLPAPKDDKERAIYEDLISLGSKKLLPPDTLRELNALDSGARKHLEKYSFKTYWGNFVPVGAYEEWKQGNCDFESKYLALGNEIVNEWKKTMDWLVDAYAVAARRGYQNLARLNPKALMLAKEKRRMSEDEFVDAFMSRIMAAIPDKDEVRASFGYESELSYIPLPSMLAEEWTKKQQIETAHQIEMEKLNAEQRLERERTQQMERMNRDVVEDARRRKQELADQFVRDLQTQSLSIIYDGFVNVLDSMQNNGGKLVGKASEQIRNTIELWRTMNLTDAPAVTQQITRIAGMMERDPKERSALEIRGLLQEIAAAARANMVSLGANPRSTRKVGIPDQIKPMELRRAKRAVQLNLKEE